MCMLGKRRLHYIGTYSKFLVAKVIGKTHISLRWSGSKIYLRKSYSDIQVFKEIFLEDEYLPAVQYVKKDSDMIIIDLGSHIGMTSLYFNHFFPNAQYICVEPSEENVSLLKKNTLNKGNFKIILNAIANEDKKCNYYCYSWWSSGTIMKDINDARISIKSRPELRNMLPKREIETISMRTLLNKFNLQKVNLLKIDIEGAELWLFQGDVSWLERVEVIAMELHEKYIDVKDILRTLTQYYFTEKVSQSGRVRIFVKDV